MAEADSSIDALSDSPEGSDEGEFIDASPQSNGSPVLGARVAGRIPSQPTLNSPVAIRIPADELTSHSVASDRPASRSPPLVHPGEQIQIAGLSGQSSSAEVVGVAARRQSPNPPRLTSQLAPAILTGSSTARAADGGDGMEVEPPDRTAAVSYVTQWPPPGSQQQGAGAAAPIPVVVDLVGSDSSNEALAEMEDISAGSSPASESSQREEGGDTGEVAAAAPSSGTESSRRSIGASSVWRDTDFQEAAGREPAAARSTSPPAARPEPTTPDKSAGGFVPGEDGHSPGAEDGHCCPICFEPWSNSGDHRIASLRCGHLFGRSCIERWLQGRDLRCPQCNDKAHRRDIRVIFAKSLRVLDTTDRDRALEQLEREREAKRRLELDFAVVQVKCEMKQNQIERLQSELAALRRQVGGSAPAPATTAAGSETPASSLSLHCTLDVSRSGGCRVMEYNSWLGMLVASQPSQNTLFPGHGVRKINTLDMQPMQFVSLHNKQVRDVRFSPEQRDLLLTCSLDRTAKLTNICSNTLVQSYQCAAPCWSCAWDVDAPHAFYLGLQNGAVLAFDTRGGREPLAEMAPPVAARSPVVALQHVPRGADDAVSGLLACRLGLCSLHETAGDRQRHDLPLEGPFVHVAFDARSRHALVSSRPSSRQPHAQHTVCRLRRPGAAAPVAEVVQVFRGGTSQRVLSRSALVPHPLRPAAPMVCASQETAQLTQLWDLASGQCVHSLPASAPVLDVCPLDVQDKHFLALLTEKQVKMYRWQVED